MACCLVVVSLQVAWVGQVASRFQVIRDGQVGSVCQVESVCQVVCAEARCREFARGFLRLRPGFRSLEPRDDGCWRKHPSYRKFLMTPWQQRTSKLTQRMAEDMLLRNMSQSTIDAYTYHIGRFAQFLGRSPDGASPEDVRSFQLHLIRERKIGWSSFNQAVCGLRFLYRHTFPR